MQTGNLFHRAVAKSALSGGMVPPSDADAFPAPEFAMSDKGTLIFRMRRSAEQAEPWREATDKDRERYALAFSRFLAQCSPTFSPTTEEKEALLRSACGLRIPYTDESVRRASKPSDDDEVAELPHKSERNLPTVR
jgi:hypothetical protein